MNTRGHIFFSYRSLEMDFAIRLAADLKNAGVNVWMDRLDIKPGDDWVAALQEGVNNSAAVIAVLSPEYVSAKYCRNELSRAVRLGRPIFPILLRPLPNEEWPIEIERHQYTDFTRWQDESVYNKRVEELVATLKRMSSGQILQAPDVETQYLTRLVAELEARQEILAYVELPMQPQEQTSFMRPMPRAGPLLSANSRFSVLEQKPDGTAENAPAEEQEKVWLSSIHEAVAKYPRFVLVGPLGAGKTTTLHRLMLEAARSRQADHSAPLPFLVDLSTWNDDRSLTEFVCSAWPFSSDVMPLLARGEVFLYLDGLSEMGGSAEPKVEMLRQWMRSPNAPQRIIITCQADGYTDDLCLDLPVVMTDGLDEQHVRQFIANYVGDETADRLLARIFPPPDMDGTASADLSSLVQNPLALTALAMLYKGYPDGEMPRNMGALFKQLIGELWERERLRRVPSGHSFEVMENAFSRLAFVMTDTDQPVYMPRSYFLEYVADEELIWAAQSAMLLETQGGNIRFGHPLIHDYFAAVGLRDEGLVTRLTYPTFNAQGERLPGKWDRIIVSLSGVTAQPDRVIENISEVDPFLALECLATGIQVTPHIYQQSVNRLYNALRIQSSDGESDEDRRVAAIRLLAMAGDERTLPLLLDTLRDANWEIRRAAAKTLKYVATPPMPGLIEALMNPEPEMREATAVALRQLGEDAVPVLLKGLQSSEWMARRGAAWALGELRDAAAVPSLIEMLADEDKLVRRESAIALGWIRDEAAIPGLLSALHDPAWLVRKSACEALCWIGVAAVPALIETLKDKSNEVRRLAVEALGRNDHPIVIPTLMEVSHDQSADVRASAAEALGQTRNPAVVPRLIEALTDTAKPRWSDQRVCDLAAKALEQVGTPEALGALQKWRGPSINAAGKEKEAPMAVKPTESPGSAKKTASQAKTRLQKITHNAPDWPTRQRAVERMGESGEPNVVPEIIKALADENSAVRVAAVAALARIRSEDSLHGLLQALQDEDYIVSDAAAEALVKIGAPTVPGLLKSLRTGSVNVRAIAIDALGRIGNAAAVPALKECLRDTRTPLLSEKRLCDLAAEALENIGGAEALALVARWRTLVGPLAARPQVVKMPPPRKSAYWEDFAGLLNALHSHDWPARQEAARALREYAKTLKGKRESVVTTRLCEELDDADWLIRSAAADALAWVADPSSVPALIARVSDTNWMVRLAAIRALAEVGDLRAVPELVRGLKDTHKLVREASADGLGRLGSAAALPSLLESLADPETFVRRAAIEALGELKSREAVTELVNALADIDQQVRWAAAEALGKIADPRSVAGLARSLNDVEGTSWETRRVSDVAADALERIGTPEARSLVEQYRRDGHLP